MSENLFCPGQKVLRNHDAWYRTFKGLPKMNKPVKKMLDEYMAGKDYTKAFIFFTGHCEFDADYSAFLVRELKRIYER